LPDLFEFEHEPFQRTFSRDPLSVTELLGLAALAIDINALRVAID